MSQTEIQLSVSQSDEDIINITFTTASDTSRIEFLGCDVVLHYYSTV